MLKLLKTPGAVVLGLLAGACFAPGQAAIARPGTVNYAEGQVLVDGQMIGAKQLGSAEVGPGGVLETSHGKAEMLLTPGVFLRLGDSSAVKMISPSLNETRVELLRGQAMLEVAQLQKENHLDVVDHGALTQVEKSGLFRFNADLPSVAVYDGKAKVQEDDRTVEVGKGKELPLGQDTGLKPQKFDRHETDSLYEWSKLRSEYLAEANASSVRTIVVNQPAWWYGTGWYWNPWYSTWAFVPGNGLFYSPFGYGFYSPAYWAYNPPLYYYYRPGHVVTGSGKTGSTAGQATQPAPVGGSGVRFGAPPAARTAPAPSAPAMHAPAVGGSGVRFGSTAPRR